MANNKQKLTQIDWLKAGFQALTQSGPEALKAEKLARYMGTSKGSFYWHFKDVADFKNKMLSHWIEQAFSAVTAEVEIELAPIARLMKLMELAASTPEEYGGKQVEPAIRAWARSDPAVAEAVRKIDENRISYLATLLKDANAEYKISAALIYAAYVGYLSLEDVNETSTAQGLKRLVESLLPQ